MDIKKDNRQIPGITPIVIIGMHRSGTSMLARLLRECGLFIGADIQGNNESVLFMQINNDILRECFATWNMPFSAHQALQNESLVSKLADNVYEAVDAGTERFLGSNCGHGIQRLVNSDCWGWKDPRNTFTLPVWQRVFPDLKIIHILRHGVDVANSLMRRDSNPQNRLKLLKSSALTITKGNLGLYHARPFMTLEQSFLLWETYAEKAVQQVQDYGKNAIQLRYEDMLSAPRVNIEKLLGFCGITDLCIPSNVLDSLIANKAFGYRKNPELVEFTTRWKITLEKFGY